MLKVPCPLASVTASASLNKIDTTEADAEAEAEVGVETGSEAAYADAAA